MQESRNSSRDVVPVARADRIEFWDVLRGVAVLGVLLANMPWMSFAQFFLNDSDHWYGHAPSLIDMASFWFVRLFADTKFITIFSTLFGAGLGLAAEKARERGADSLGFQLRRLGVLFVFGMLHGSLIWFGDILAHYATIGVVVVLLRKQSASTLHVIAGVCLAMGFSAYFVVSPLVYGPMQPPSAVAPQLAAIVEIYQSGDFWRMAAHRAPHYLFGYLFIIPLWGLRTLGLCLLGMAMVKSGVLRAPSEHDRVYRSMLRWGLVVAIPAHALWVYGGLNELPALIAMGSYLAALGASPVYLAVVKAWCDNDVMTKLRAKMAAVGRMAFTNYISHSVITAFVFNYCGQFDRWGRGEGLLLTFAIFVFQLWASDVWLGRFRFGPLEWLWRSLTYARFQSMKRATP